MCKKSHTSRLFYKKLSLSKTHSTSSDEIGPYSCKWSKERTNLILKHTREIVRNEKKIVQCYYCVCVCVAVLMVLQISSSSPLDSSLLCNDYGYDHSDGIIGLFIFSYVVGSAMIPCFVWACECDEILCERLFKPCRGWSTSWEEGDRRRFDHPLQLHLQIQLGR